MGSWVATLIPLLHERNIIIIAWVTLEYDPFSGRDRLDSKVIMLSPHSLMSLTSNSTFGNDHGVTSVKGRHWFSFLFHAKQRWIKIEKKPKAFMTKPDQGYFSVNYRPQIGLFLEPIYKMKDMPSETKICMGSSGRGCWSRSAYDLFWRSSEVYRVQSVSEKNQPSRL